MDKLPSNIMFHIFSKLPAKCLARSRCASKVWCEYIDDRYLMTVYDERVIEEPIPILYHTHLDRERITRSLCFHIIESKQTETATTDHTYVLEPKVDPFLKILRKKPLSENSYVQINARGSCNGLMCLSRDEDYLVTSLVVVHPLKRECYELPSLPSFFHSSMVGESCGLGFDASTNKLKMVCVLLKDHIPSMDLDMDRKNLYTMVHVFGTNSWRDIPKVPPYPISNGAVFANDCLHWMVLSYPSKKEGGGIPVIWFDVKIEEFGLIDPPNRTCNEHRGCSIDHLVDLNGEVGYVCCKTAIDIWILKQKQWVPHCHVKCYAIGNIEVLGCWNKDGDILIRSVGSGEYKFSVYNLKSDVMHKTNIFVPYTGPPNIFMHPNKLFSIHGIGTKSFLMKKPDLKKSCKRLKTIFK